jgi:hypothetical protein
MVRRGVAPVLVYIGGDGERVPQFLVGILLRATMPSAGPRGPTRRRHRALLVEDGSSTSRLTPK